MESVQSYQNPKDVFCRNRKTHPKMHLESQGTPNSQNNIEKEQALELDSDTANMLDEIRLRFKTTMSNNAKRSNGKNRQHERTDRNVNREMEILRKKQTEALESKTL